MTDREKLIELICKAHNAVTAEDIENDDISYADAMGIEADVLIANGSPNGCQLWLSGLVMAGHAL